MTSRSKSLLAHVTPGGDDDHDDAIVLVNTDTGTDAAALTNGTGTLPPYEAASPLTQGVLLGAAVFAIVVILVVIRTALRKSPRRCNCQRFDIPDQSAILPPFLHSISNVSRAQESCEDFVFHARTGPSPS